MQVQASYGIDPRFRSPTTIDFGSLFLAGTNTERVLQERLHAMVFWRAASKAPSPNVEFPRRRIISLTGERSSCSNIPAMEWCHRKRWAKQPE